MSDKQALSSTSTHAEPSQHAATGASGRLADADSPRQMLQGAQIAQLQQAESSADALAQKPAQGGLPEGLRSGIEVLSGMDMSGVRVHRNSGKPAQLNAHAYAQGNDIHLGPGQERLLPHEAWHVVQQAEGRVKPTMQLAGGVTVNDDAGLEREANVMGEKALRPARPLTSAHGENMKHDRNVDKHISGLTSNLKVGIESPPDTGVLVHRGANLGSKGTQAAVQRRILIGHGEGQRVIERPDHMVGSPAYEFMTEVNTAIEAMGFVRSVAAQGAVRHWIWEDENHFADINQLVNVLMAEGHLTRPVRGAALGPRGLGPRPIFTPKTMAAVPIGEGEHRRHVISSSTLGRAIEDSAGDFDAVRGFLERRDQAVFDPTGNDALDLARVKRAAWAYVNNHIGNLWSGAGPVNIAIGFIRGPLTLTCNTLQEQRDQGQQDIALADPLFNVPLPQGIPAAGPGAAHWVYVTDILTETLNANANEEHISLNDAIEIYRDVIMNCDLDRPQPLPAVNTPYTIALHEIYLALRTPIAIFDAGGALDRFVNLNLDVAQVDMEVD